MTKTTFAALHVGAYFDFAKVEEIPPIVVKLDGQRGPWVKVDKERYLHSRRAGSGLRGHEMRAPHREVVRWDLDDFEEGQVIR